MKYIKVFKKHTDYLNYIAEHECILAYCQDNIDIHFKNLDYSKCYLTFKALESGTISLNIPYKLGTDYITSISYSTNDGITWTTITNKDNKSENLVIDVNVNTGDNILWKGNATAFTLSSDDDYNAFFSSTCRFDAKGNIMSLLYGDNFKNQTTLTESYIFYMLFYDYQECEKECLIVNAKNLILPATILSDGCYSGMFEDCTSLTTAPELPATTLAPGCYSSMFNGCTSLTTAPELPATTLTNSCYSMMFYGCTSLTSAPELPAITLFDYCYNYMFQNCTSLTTAPELPATTLARSCYAYMFRDCTALTTAPELPATTLASECYNGMFYNCTKLTTAPELPATTLAQSCYANMFNGCTSLTTAPELPATTLTNSCYSMMFNGCTKLTTAPELPATTLTISCYYYMFNGCTSLTTSPSLPATTLAIYCYANMFHGCTNLTTAPELPAITLVDYCYNDMLSGCTSLNYIKAMFTTTPSNTYTRNWVSNVASSGTFVKNSEAQWNVTGVNGIPTNWTVQTACLILSDLTNIISNIPSIVLYESSLNITFTLNQGYVITECSVTMSGNDITSSVYSGTTINIQSVTGTVEIIAKASEIIVFEEFTKNKSKQLIGSSVLTEVEDGSANITEIRGNTFVFNQLFETTGSEVEPISDVTYLLQINNERSVVTATADTSNFIAETPTDMCINLTHLYGANARSFALTQTQFEEFFPESYYSYEQGKVINTVITSFSSEGIHKDKTSFNTSLNIPITTMSGKLNGEGESVIIFPDGMCCASNSDYIVYQNNRWEAIKNVNKRTFDLTGTYTSWGKAYYTRAMNIPASEMTKTSAGKHIVCKDFMTISSATMNGYDKSGYVALLSSTNSLTVYLSKTDYESGNYPSSIIGYYTLNTPKTYVLDNEYQTILNTAFSTNVGTTESVLPVNGLSPTTAPVMLFIDYPVIDYVAKNICVTNWGNNVVPNEITKAEAAAVTNIAPVSDGNRYFAGTKIQRFNEFQYFTRLNKITTTNTIYDGTFQGCTTLEAITLPPTIGNYPGNNSVVVLSAMFHGTQKLIKVDMSDMTFPSNVYLNIYGLVRASKIEEIVLPSARIKVLNSFANSNTSLKKIVTTGATFGDVVTSDLTLTFYGATNIETVEGGFTGFKVSLNLSNLSKLTGTSGNEILRSLGTPTSSATITFSNATAALLSDVDIASAVNKGWNVAAASGIVVIKQGDHWSGGANYATSGSGYTATITPDTCYAITSVSVSMGGVDITSTAYSNGQVNIASVTGNILIVVSTEYTYDAVVEYLQGDGAAYIDIGVNCRNVLNIQLEVMYDVLPNAVNIFFGSYFELTSSSLPKLQIGSKVNNVWLTNMAGSPIPSSSGITSDGSITANQKYTINLNTISQASDNTLYLFARNNDKGNYLPSTARIYKLIITDNGTIIRDFIPVRKNSVGYLYDKVSGTLFGNTAGSGAFTYGLDV